VARFDPVKKHDVLVEALATVRKRHPKAVLLLAGDGPEKERIRQRASELEVHVEFKPGAIAWNKNAYASCSLYVTSSSKEGLPLARPAARRRWPPRSSLSSTIPSVADEWGRRDAPVS
jgi:glycosyltransferase involved in cell wall biosynthesis